MARQFLACYRFDNNASLCGKYGLGDGTNAWLRGAVLTGERWDSIVARDADAMARFMDQRARAQLYP